MRTANLRRGVLRRSLGAGAAAIAGLALVAPGASAAEGTVTAGSANWGVKESFRNYVESPTAAGQITASGGATRRDDGTFDFRPASGTFDPAADSANAKFGGSVLFTGHAGILRFKLTDPRVRYTGNAGTLYADVTSNDANGQQKNYPNVDFAALDMTGIDPVDDGSTATVSAVPMKLTENGAKAFAGFYEAGEDLDPITFTIEYSNRVTDPDPPDPAPDDEAGSISPGPRTQTVSKSSREVILAEVTCAIARCDLSAAPEKIAAKITGGASRGHEFSAKVKAPSTVAKGETAAVTVKLKKGVARRLGDGSKATLATKIELSGPGSVVAKKARVSVKGE